MLDHACWRLTIFRIVQRVLDVIRARQCHRALMRLQFAQVQVNSACRRAGFVDQTPWWAMSRALRQFQLRVAGQQSQKCALRIGARNHCVRANVFAIRKHHADCARPGGAFIHQHVAHARAGRDFRARRARRARNRLRNRAHSAADKSPQTAVPIDAAHHVMQQNICCSRRARPAVAPITPSVASVSLDLLGFKPRLRKIPRRSA